MRITSKGQVTIPQRIREQAGMLPGSEVEFECVDGKVVVRAVASPRSKGWEAIHRAKGKGNEPMFRGWTTDRIMAFLRSED